MSDLPEAIYYIYAPPWVTWSAGIRVLHYLCEELNVAGFQAFLVIHGPKSKNELNSNTHVPLLTKGLIREHKKVINPIVAIYPESIRGNPLGAPFVIRWLLNFPSLLGGSEAFKKDTVFAYSQVLATDYANKTGVQPKVLFLPALKLTEIENVLSQPLARKQNFELVYAQKYRALGGTPDVIGSSVKEITRFGKAAPRRSETLRLIREAAAIHVYENTTAITEACLLGTPVVCHKNEYFNKMIASNELPFSGISWSKENLEYPDVKSNFEILKKAEVDSKNNLKMLFESLEFETNLNRKIRVKLPRRGLVTFHSLSRGYNILAQKGPIVFLRFLKNYIGRQSS